MNLLEDMYVDVLLNEKLSEINISPELITQELEKEYEEYRKRIKRLYPKKVISFPKQQNDERLLKNIIAIVKDQDISYTYIINNFIKTGDLNRLKKSLVLADHSWRNNISKSEMSWFMKNQPLNIAFINLIKQLGLINFPIKFNKEGWPEYPKHLLNKFVAMNILEQMINNGTITPEQKETIDNLLFDESTKKIIEKEINDYKIRTKSKYREEPETGGRMVDTDVNSTEIPAPEKDIEKELTKDTEDMKKRRLEMIRKIMSKKQ